MLHDLWGIIRHLFLLNRGDYGVLGHGDEVSVTRPKAIDALKEVVMAHVSCGVHHTVVASAKGVLYSWGMGHDTCRGREGCEEERERKGVRETKRKTRRQKIVKESMRVWGGVLQSL